MFDEPIEAPVALVFPGQGAQEPALLQRIATLPGFARRHRWICELLGFDLQERLTREPTLINANGVSSLLTVLASLCALELWRESATGTQQPLGMAGYSVGQWSALHAAGSMDETTLLALVVERAHLMDKALAENPPSGMLAVIGVPQEGLAGLCADAIDRGFQLFIANENAPGQFTLSGDLAGLAHGEDRLRAEFGPKRLLRVPVAGGWHSPFLASAVTPLQRCIESLTLAPCQLPVIDNVTGDFLPQSPSPAQLAAQVAAPVRWMQGIRRLVAAGARSIVELGYGDTLTRFGFFIDRSVRHRALLPPVRGR
ncbi:MAG: ACP S-malonyltransferase [Candidatus Competibacterales bacterium]